MDEEGRGAPRLLFIGGAYGGREDMVVVGRQRALTFDRERVSHVRCVADKYSLGAPGTKPETRQVQGSCH